MTDSATVCGWTKSAVTGDRQIKTHGAAEMLVKRRLATLRELVTEYDLKLTVSLVKSEANRANVLTRVSKTWLTRDRCREVGLQSDGTCAVTVADLHGQHHFGTERMLFLAKLVDPAITREEVERCVRSCVQCQSIDPAPASHEPGSIQVQRTWNRLAADVTHYRGKRYLTFVDCGPSVLQYGKRYPLKVPKSSRGCWTSFSEKEGLRTSC